jgi:hypothetical protein
VLEVFLLYFLFSLAHFVLTYSCQELLFFSFTYMHNRADWLPPWPGSCGQATPTDPSVWNRTDGCLGLASRNQTSPTRARRGEDIATGSSIWKGGKVDVRPRRVGWSASGIAGFCRRDELGEGLYRVDDTILGFLVLNYYWDICLNVPG